MKILFTAPLRKVSENASGAREYLIYVLANAMVRKGHEVTLLGTADSSIPGVTIIPAIQTTFSDLPAFENPFYAHTSYLIRMAEQLVTESKRFDLIHNHTYPEFFITMLTERIRTPMLTTIHAQATPELDEVLSLFQTEYVAVSEAHNALFVKTAINQVIYNGVDTDLFAYQEEKDDYLLWLGRVGAAKDKEGQYLDIKGVKWAIRLAQETGQKLIMGGKVEDIKFFEGEIKPHLSEKIQWMGDPYAGRYLSRSEVIKLMQKAKVFLMPVNWEEPFGMVMVEAMSCGTPVIGFDRGAVSEIIADGKTGYVVSPESGIEGLKGALSRISLIHPSDCRERVEAHFSLNKMIQEYEALYRQRTEIN